MSDLGSRVKASLIPFYPFWEVEIGSSPRFDGNVLRFFHLFCGGVSVAGGGLLFFEKRSCLPSLKKWKGGTYLTKKKGKGKIPKDSACPRGVESLQVLACREMGTEGSKIPSVAFSSALPPREMGSGQIAPAGKATPKAGNWWKAKSAFLPCWQTGN